MILDSSSAIVMACDVDPKRYLDVLGQTDDIPEIGAYQIPVSLAEDLGLELAVSMAKDKGKKIIYDRKGLGTGDPDNADRDSEYFQKLGIDAVVLYPIGGSLVMRSWVKSLRSRDIGIIVNGLKSWPEYTVREGGYVWELAWQRIYDDAAKLGLRSFQFPANRPTELDELRREIDLLERENVEGDFQIDIEWFAVGLGKQGGNIEGAYNLFGKNLRPTAGRVIHEEDDIRGATLRFIERINAGKQ